MKKNILLSIVGLMSLSMASYLVYTSYKEKMSDLMLMNLEALADSEDSETCRWSRVFDSQGCVYHVCVFNGNGETCTCGDVTD